MCLSENNFSSLKTIFLFLFECLVGCQIKTQYILPSLPMVYVNLPDPHFATTVTLSPSPSDCCQKH